MRIRTSIRWRLAVPYVLLILAAVGSLTVYSTHLLRRTVIRQETEQLLVDATILSRELADSFAAGDYASVMQVVNDYAAMLSARVTVVGIDGTVLAESDNDPGAMRNHWSRPEIQEALASGSGSSVRDSDTLGIRMVYAAVRVDDLGGQAIGFVRLAIPARDLTAEVSGLREALLIVSLGASLLAIALAIAIADTASRPIRQLTAVVRRLAQGDLDQRLIRSTRDEVGQLTVDTMQVADQLRASIANLKAERVRLEAVLDNMADGVIITDGEGLVSLINPAAQTMVSGSESVALGRSFTQVVRQHEIVSVWQACVASGEPRVELVDLGDLFLQILATPLLSIEPDACLVVLQDLSQVRRLEGMRRELVSNISHELRTPLASMRAIADTLRDGALHDSAAAEHFLDRMDGEIDSLTQMVEELLELSRIESGQVPIRLERISVDSFIVPAVQRLIPQADRSQLTLRMDLADSLPLVLGDEQRLQQVVTNLVHNAIKFTPSGGTITIRAAQASDRVVVTVSDTGIGVPQELQSRIFERFFKADRSRATAGTGLGLAIAKHIVQGHGGRIWVESQEGQGSQFHFSLLLADERSQDLDATGN